MPKQKSAQDALTETRDNMSQQLIPKKNKGEQERYYKNRNSEYYADLSVTNVQTLNLT